MASGDADDAASGILGGTACLEGIMNPGNLPLTETREGVQHVTTLLEKSQAAHAADASENAWFRSPSVFTEYTYTDSRDKRLGGYTSHMRDGTVGLDFLTAGDVAMSLMGTFGGTAADTGIPEHIVNNADNYGLTLTAAKSCNWLLMGASAGYNNCYTRARDTVDNESMKDRADGLTVAPFVGAMYTMGDLSLATVPTYMFNWNWQDYDSTISTSDDHVSSETFVWVNTASYNICEKLVVGLEADWNRITHIKKNLVAPTNRGDREWVTFGPKITYRITPNLSAYLSGTKALCSGSYDEVQGVVGMSYGF